MKKLFLGIILLLGIQTISRAQNFSNKGTDFYITYPAHIDGPSSAMGIYITSDVNATGKIVVGNQTIPFTVTANSVTRKFIGPNATGDAPNTSVYLTQQDGIATASAIHVTSDNPVVVYSHIIRSARSGATLVLPTNVWGNEYIVPSYPSISSSGAGNGGVAGGVGIITVVAAEANTSISITPSVASINGARTAGTPYQITLANPGDVYQIQFRTLADISGTVVKSASSGSGGCKKIAVFSSTSWSAFDCTSSSGGDNLYQQLFPTGSWGKNFMTAPFKNRNYDVVRVFVKNTGTNVYKLENGIQTQLTGLSAVGNYYEYKTANPTFITADQPISVVQYITSTTCKAGCTTTSTNVACLADPEMVVLNPIEQTINNITVFAAHKNYVPTGQSNVTNCFLNIIIPSNATASFKINGSNPSSGFMAIQGTNYSYLQEEITSLALTNPVQNLTADSSFIAIAYGFGTVESYGYNAGTNVKDFTQLATFQTSHARIDSPVACINTPFQFSVPLNFQPTSIQWDYSKAPNITPNTTVTVSNPATVLDSVSAITGLKYYSTRNTYTFIAPNTTSVRDTIKVYTTSATADGCGSTQQTFSIPVIVSNLPSANFTTISSGCVSDPVQFKDATNVNGTSKVIYGLWNYGNGTKDSAYNPIKTFTIPQTYNVRYQPVTNYGCIGDTTIPFSVSSVPVAGFTYSDSCVNKTIVLTDTSKISVGTIVKWYWDYGDGTKDTLTTNISRTKVYNTVGTYAVSLIVESNTGCKSTAFIQPITIRPLPLTNFIVPNVVCLPVGAALFSDSSKVNNGTIVKWKWNFGDGGIDSVANPVHNYSAMGPFTVKLTAISNYGCAKDSSKIVTNIYAQPKARFGMNTFICLRDSAVYSDSSDGKGSNIAKWRWSFGDGITDTIQNTKHVYAASGIDSVKLFVYSDKGCISDTAIQTITVNPLPLAGFYTQAANNYCEKRAVKFIDTAINRSITTASLSRWYWDMGNGKTLSPTGGYNTAFNQYYDTFGVYTVKMMVENNIGCKSDTVIKQVTIHGLPQVGFTLPAICLDDAEAHFTDSTRFADIASTEAAYLWNYNGGSPPVSPGPTNSSFNTQNGSTRYNTVGSYKVSFKVTSNYGCDSTLTQSITVNGSKPHADFAVLNSSHLCSNDSIRIQDNSTVDFGTTTRNEIFWDIVNVPVMDSIDNAPYTTKKYAHLYPNFSSPANKTISIKLIAHSGNSSVCQNSITKTFVLNQSPVVQFTTVPGICNDTTARQITQATEIGGVPGTFAYYGTGVNNTGLYTPQSVASGTYAVKAVYTTAMTCADSATRNITVWPSPVAKWGVSAPLCEKNNITFTDSSVANYKSIAARYWDFGDGTTAVYNNTTTSFIKKYAAGNNYTVSLRVMSDSGCRSTYNVKTLNVHYLPVVNFGLPSICLPDGNGVFTDSSVIADNSQSLFSYLWNFGDPNDATPSTLKNPSHKYSALGPVNVQLKVTSKDACTDSLTKQLNSIYPQPKAGFSITPDTVCVGDFIRFTDLSNGITGKVVKWNWDLSGGSVSSLQNPTRRFTDSGNFNISLYIYNQQNCISDTMIKQVVVYPYPKLTMGPNLFMLQGGIVVIKPVYIYGNGLQYLWTPTSYLSSDTARYPTATPPDDITYKLTLTGLGGCAVSDTVFIKVLKEPLIPNAFSPNGDGINDTWVIKYLESYPGATVDIYNRYGQNVFHSEGYSVNWDGTLKGQPLPIGTYYYIVDPKNGRQKMQGSVTIIR